MTGGVVVVGSINADLVASLPHLPAPGETVLASSLARLPGGKGANQAVAAARAGATVMMIGAIGADDDGEDQLGALADEGVDVSMIRRAAAPTGLALIGVAPDGANQIIVAAGANAELDPAWVRTGMMAAAASVALISLEVALPAVQAAIRVARERGMQVVLNPAPARELPGDLLLNVICTPNRGELARLSGVDEIADGAMALLARGAQAVVVTIGERGSAVWDADGRASYPALAVAVVDTTGAGDCFNGVLAAALAGGEAIRPAVRLATVAAGLSVGALGARGGFPEAAEIAAALPP